MVKMTVKRLDLISTTQTYNGFRHVIPAVHSSLDVDDGRRPHLVVSHIPWVGFFISAISGLNKCSFRCSFLNSK